MVQNKNTISICVTEETPTTIQFKLSALQCTNDYSETEQTNRNDECINRIKKTRIQIFYYCALDHLKANILGIY